MVTIFGTVVPSSEVNEQLTDDDLLLFTENQETAVQLEKLLISPITDWLVDEVVCCMRTGTKCSDEAIDNCNKLAPNSSETDISKYCRYCRPTQLYIIGINFYLPVTFTFTGCSESFYNASA